jgi:sugar phosphate isomerase/epimerase
MTRPHSSPSGELNLLAILGRDFLRRWPAFGLELTLSSPKSVPVVLSMPFVRRNARVIHLPYTFEGRRINIADTERTFRRKSIALIVEMLKRASEIPGIIRYVVHPLALETWDGKPRGTFSAAVDGFGEILHRSASYLRCPIALENNRVYFPSNPRAPRPNRIFADNPAEWMRLAKAVAHPAFGLCLDASHAVTTALLRPRSRRDAVLRRFLSAGTRIIHVHWSGNFPYDRRGRNDSHEAIGAPGTQRMWFHRAVSRLDATKTIEVLRPERVEASLGYLERHDLLTPR